MELEAEKIRKEVAYKLLHSDVKKRVSLSKNELDYLLFDYFVLNKELDIVAKIPVWSGSFLSKIDLSNVSFENVAWSIISTDYDNTLNYYDIPLDEDAKKKVKHYYCLGMVDYSNTNAHIYFDKSWEVKNFDEIRITSCNFENTDLSYIDMGKLTFTNHVNLNNSNIMLPLSNRNLRMCNTSLVNCDLSTIEIDGTELLSGYKSGRSIFDVKCCLRDSKIKIKYDKTKVTKEDINKTLKIGKINGCYLEENFIDSNGELEKEKIYTKRKRILPCILFDKLDEQLNNSK